MREKLYLATLAVAISDLRRQVREEGGSNDGRVVRHILRNAGIKVPAPWCAAWIQDITDAAAAALGTINPLDAVSREALVADCALWAEQKPAQRIVAQPSQAITGDLVLFNFGGKTWDHIGIVLVPPRADAASTEFRTIEGNTNEAGGREGDGVYPKTRRITTGRQLFVRWA